MRVVIHAMNALGPYENPPRTEAQIVEVDVEEDATISQLFDRARSEHQLHISEIDLKQYYPIRDQHFFSGAGLPYVIAGGMAVWDPEYRDVKVRDFFSTHGIKDGTIYVFYGVPQAGGPNINDIYTMWLEFDKIIQSLDAILGLSGAAVAGLEYARRRLRKKWPPKGVEHIYPGSVFSLVVKRHQWNPSELADLTGLDREDAKHLLRLCHFEWDQKRMAYVQTPGTTEVVRRLNNVSWGQGV